jgi:hypothetical protein
VILTLSQIFLQLDGESDLYQGLTSVIVRPHLGDPIAQFDIVTDLPVDGVGGVVSTFTFHSQREVVFSKRARGKRDVRETALPVGHDPFVDTENTTGLEDLEDLTVDTFERRSVTSGLNSVDYSFQFQLSSAPSHLKKMFSKEHERTCIETILPKLFAKFHKVSLPEIDQMTESSLLSVLPRTSDLEIVIVHSGDGGIGEMSDLTSGTSDTAPHVEDFHSFFKTDLGG